MPRKIIHLFFFLFLLSSSQLSHAQDFMPSGLNTDGGGNIGMDPPFDDGWDPGPGDGGEWDPGDGGDWNPGTGGGDPVLPPEDIDDPEWGGSPGDGGGDGPPDDDDCSYCDGYDDEEEMEADNRKIIGQVGYRVTPSISIDLDGYTYIVNLSENTNVGKVEPNKTPISEKGFKVIKMRRGGLSLSVKGSAYLSGFAAVSASLGVNVAGGLAWVAERHVKTYPEIKKLPFITRVPSEPEDLKKLAVGDSVTFQMSGTIGIHVGLSIGPMQTGVEANVTGTWTTNVRKTGRNLVQVAYTKGNAKAVQIMVGTIGMKKAKKWYRNLRETQAYEFDLSKRDGLKLYKRMLKGDVATVKKYYLKQLAVFKWQKFAKANMIDQKRRKMRLARIAFRKWKTKIKSKKYSISKRDQRIINTFFKKLTAKMITIGTRQTTGTAVESSVGLPIFFRYNWTSGDRSVVVEKTREITDGMIGTNYMGVYKESKATSGVLTHHSNQIKLFMGGFQEIVILNPGQRPSKSLRMFGQLKYEYHRTKWNEKKWDEKIKQAAARLGHRKALTSIKRPYDGKAKFGQHSADLLLSQNTFRFWMNWAKKNKPDILVKMALWEVDKWFKNKSHKRKEICLHLVRGLCKRDQKREVKKSIPRAVNLLKEMSEGIPTGKEEPKVYVKKLKAFAKNMADFGANFAKNQFTLNAFLNLARKSPGDQYMVFQWQGSPFARGYKVLLPSKKYKFKGHQICGIIGSNLKDRCDRPTKMDPM